MDEEIEKLKKTRHINFEDLELCMQKLGVPPNLTEIQDIENKFKLDGKLHVEETDFVRIMSKNKRYTDELSTNDLRKAFKLIDADNSLSIDKEEFEDLLK